MNHPEVIRFLVAHHGVASVDQLRGLNFGKHALVRARRQGLLVSPARGVVALAGRELSFEGRAVVAQLAAGGEAFVSGPSAGVLHGLRGMPTSTDRGVDQTDAAGLIFPRGAGCSGRVGSTRSVT